MQIKIQRRIIGSDMLSLK